MTKTAAWGLFWRPLSGRFILVFASGWFEGSFTPMAVWMMRILTFGMVKIDRESLEAVIYGWVLLLAVAVAATVAAIR